MKSQRSRVVRKLAVAAALSVTVIVTVGTVYHCARPPALAIESPDASDENTLSAHLIEPARTALVELLSPIRDRILGPPERLCEFERQTGKSLYDRQKTVLVYCDVPADLIPDSGGIDRDLEKWLAGRLYHNKIRVVDPDRITDWLSNNDDWSNVWEIGAAFQVDYIVSVRLKDFSLYEDTRDDFFRGRCSGVVTLIEMNTDRTRGSAIYNRAISSQFPRDRPISGEDNYWYDNFKPLYVKALASEIAELFLVEYAGDALSND